MTDEEIIASLTEARDLAPVRVAELLVQLRGESELTEFELISYFFRAFRDIPLTVLREAATWHRLRLSGGLTDKEFDELLAPWLGPTRSQHAGG